MSVRNSGFERVARDAYQTPRWVTAALTNEIADTPRLPRGSVVWEPAAGTCQMVEGLQAAEFNVIPSDIAPPGDNVLAADFLKDNLLPFAFDAIITNPPYNRAEEFVRRSLELTAPTRGLVAMFLSVDFDSAKTRRDLFDEHPAWGLKITLLDRVWWFDPEPGDKGPSANHAWFVWCWRGSFGRTMRYANAPAKVLADIRLKKKPTPASNAKQKTKGKI